MRYLAEKIANFDRRRLLAGIFAIACAVSVAGVSLSSASGLGDFKVGGWDWSFGLVEELASEGAKLESEGAGLPSSAVHSISADDSLSLLISYLAPALAPIFDLVSTHIPFVSSLTNLGAHSATSPPVRA